MQPYRLIQCNENMHKVLARKPVKPATEVRHQISIQSLTGWVRMGQNESSHKKITATAKQPEPDMYNVLKVRRKNWDFL